MASTDKKSNDTLSDLDCLRAIFVQNLPSDVTKELLECLFPEASEIKLNVDRHGNYKRRSSIILFPKASHALYYADQDRSIKLDQKLLSIQSMVDAESSLPSRKKEHACPSNPQDRDRKRDHDKDRTSDRPSQNSRSSDHPRSSPTQKSSTDHRSLSPSYSHKHENRSSSHRDAHSRTRSSQHDSHSSRSSDGKERKILIKNLPVSVSRSIVLSRIPNAKDITIDIDDERNTAMCVVEFYTAKEAEVFLKQSHHIQIDRHVLIAEPYKIERADRQQNPKLRARSQSPHRRVWDSPIYRSSRHRSRSPIIRHRSPLLESRSTRRHRSPLLQSPRLKILSPPPENDRFHYTLNSATKKQNNEREDDRRFVAITNRVDGQFNSKMKGRSRSPENDRYHYTAKSSKKQSHDDDDDDDDDRRFVAIGNRVGEQFSSKQWGRGVESILQEEQERYSDKHSGAKTKDMFDQFKDQAKKFATENPNSARALNQILVALGQSNKTETDSPFTSSLDDLKNAFNPEDKLRADEWCKNDVDFRTGDGRMDPDSSEFMDMPKLSSVLEQVKDLNQNLGILSQLAKLAKHLKTDRNDSNIATMALSTLENLIFKTVWPNSNSPKEGSQSNSGYNNQSRKSDQCYSPLPDDNYYNSQENAELSNDPKYKPIDYNHQKPAYEMNPGDRSSHSPYKNENYHEGPYDEHRQDAYEGGYWRDAFKDERRRNAYKSDNRRDAYKGDDRHDAYKGDDRRDAYKGDDRRDAYKGDDRRDAYKADDRRDAYKGDDRRDAYKGDDRRDSYKADDRRDAYKADDRRDAYKADDRRDAYKADDRRDAYKADDRRDAYKADDRRDAYKADDRRDAYKVDNRRDTFKVDNRRDAYSDEHQQDAYNDELRRVVYKNERWQDTYRNEHRHDEPQWDYERSGPSGHRSGHSHRQHDQMSESFEESFHDRDDYYQHSSPRRHTRPLDSREFHLMDPNCLGYLQKK